MRKSKVRNMYFKFNILLDGRLAYATLSHILKHIKIRFITAYNILSVISVQEEYLFRCHQVGSQNHNLVTETEKSEAPLSI